MYTHTFLNRRSMLDGAVVIAALGQKDGMLRQKAREAVVEQGELSGEALIQALFHHSRQVRWEAAKALCETRIPEAAIALALALTDDCFEVRWLAAEALVNMEELAFEPVLKRLLVDYQHPWMREAARHILKKHNHTQYAVILHPVIESLGDFHPVECVMTEAHIALSRLGIDSGYIESNAPGHRRINWTT